MSPPRRLASWRKGKGGRRGGEDGVPEPPAGVPADPAGQPRLHYCLRPHHRGRGEQLWRSVLRFQASCDWVFRKRVWAAEKPRGFGPRGGWRHPELTLGFGIVPRVPSP